MAHRKIRRRKRNNICFYAVLTVISLLAGALWGGLSTVPSFAASNLDISEGLLQSRVVQRGSGDCAVAALATAEAYMNGLQGNSQAAYDTIWNGNGQQNYIQSWTNLGYRYYGIDTDFGGDQQAFCQMLYEQLEKGVPCLVRRNSTPTHYGVIAAYSGDPQNFQLSDFTVLEVSQYTSDENALMDLQTWMNTSGGTQLNQVVVRESGAGTILQEPTDDSNQQPNVSGYEQALTETHFTVEEGGKHGSQTSASSGDSVDDSKVISFQINNPMMEINGVDVPIDGDGTSPVIRDERTVLPVRAVMEAMGAEVKWDDQSQTITLSMDGKQLNLQIDNGQAWDQNGNSYPLDVPPVIINGRTMLPIRFVAEYFGGTVEWWDTEQRVAIVCGFQKSA